MNILESLLGTQHSAALDQLTTQFGLSKEETSAAVSALAPAIATGIDRSVAADPSTITAALGQNHPYADRPTALADPAATVEGNTILGQLFGSKDVSREVAARAATSTGIDTGILKKMLPVVASLVMAGLARRAAPSALNPGYSGATRSGLQDLLAPILDRNRNGSIADDLIGAVGGLLGRRR